MYDAEKDSRRKSEASNNDEIRKIETVWIFAEIEFYVLKIVEFLIKMMYCNAKTNQHQIETSRIEFLLFKYVYIYLKFKIMNQETYFQKKKTSQSQI